jgi:aspartate aminotransferase
MPTPPPSPSLSRRVTDLKPSATVAVTNRAKDLVRQGVDVLSFAAGEPDFDTPEVIKQTAIKALLAGQTKYMPTMGDADTRKAIAEKVLRDNAIPGVTPEHVGISSGGKHALYTVCQCLFDFPAPGGGQAPAECLIPVPAWVSYMPLAELAGAKVVEIPTTGDTDFKMSPEQLRKAITPRSRMLVINSPSNPCGTMYTESELRAIAGVVAEAARTVAPDLVVLSDEIYEKVAYGGIGHFSIGSVPEIAERTITINGLSKAYAMTGWRIGYTVASGDWGLKFMKAMATLQGQMTTNITSFTYPAIRTALRECEDDAKRMCAAFAERATLIHGRMTRIPGLKVARPTGAFYVFPDVSGLFGRTTPAGKRIASSLDFCEALLAEAKVAAVPGEDFGGCGYRHARFSFACSSEQIQRGMDRLEAFVASLK